MTNRVLELYKYRLYFLVAGGKVRVSSLHESPESERKGKGSVYFISSSFSSITVKLFSSITVLKKERQGKCTLLRVVQRTRMNLEDAIYFKNLGKCFGPRINIKHNYCHFTFCKFSHLCSCYHFRKNSQKIWGKRYILKLILEGKARCICVY